MTRRSGASSTARASRAGTSAVDLDKDPAAVPDPATTPVPDELRAEIEALHGQVPGPPLGRDPRAARRPARTTAGARRRRSTRSACVMRLTPAYLDAVATFYDMLETEPSRPHDVYVCTNISCSLRGADELSSGDAGGRRRRRASTSARFECLGACDIAPMASVDGVYVGPGSTRRPRTARRLIVRSRRRAPAARPGAAPAQAARRRSAPSATDEATRRGRAVMKLLFEDIDEPGPEHARRLPAPRRLRVARARRWQMPPRRGARPSSRRPACAAAAAPASRWARRRRSSPRARWTSTSCATPTSPSPGTFKDRELMQKNPHQLIEGIVIAAYAAGREPRLHLHPRRVRLRRPTSSTPRSPRPRPRLPRRAHPRLRPHAVARRAPRRGRLHLRRGDGAARLARGQARQPAPQAAVPRQPGPLPGPDADQQRRDALHRPAHHPDGRRGVREDRHRDLDGHEGRLGLGRRPAPGQLRDRARHPVARDHLRPRRRPAGGPQDQVLVPRRLVARRCSPSRATSTSPTTSTRWPRPGRCSAPARSSSSTTPTRSSTSR